MAFGRGKVILLGEHGVVYGHPALAAGLGVGVHATARVSESDDDVIVARPWGVTARVGSDEPLALGLQAILEGMPSGVAGSAGSAAEGRPRVHVEVDVELPGGAGLGCSAAIGVAVTGALDALFAIERTAEERGDYSLRWERVFHGNPSGVDNAMAAVGGVALFRRGQPLQSVRVKKPLPLVIAHSGESSSTKEIVAMVARQRDEETQRVDEAFGAIAALVNDAKLAVEAGDLKGLGQLLDLNQMLLAGLMLSTEKIEELCRVAREEGALGAKLTGAGAGGCMIALAKDEADAERLREALAKRSPLTLVAMAGA
ncbi:MAG: mevalonate kinase [Myxococcota bacterium]|jgi:mevalonate kinase|nr:mevalonate kinase [Myxococcota bacterium]